MPSNLKHAYRLTGIVNHLGDCPTSGHYKACVFRTEVDEWYEYNDMRVQKMPGSKLFGYDSKQDCYLLFYMHR
ncbi:hypothetical protein B566_EDAN005427 [Ephemera danica]|nr:hypothetical protein B566_EDAN005427 [Ephemera danica]